MQRKKVSTYMDRLMFISFTVYTQRVHLHKIMVPLTEKGPDYPLVLLSETCHNKQNENLQMDLLYLKKLRVLRGKEA